MFRVNEMNRGVSTMRHASYPTTGSIFSGSVLTSRTSQRRRFFAALLGALQRSRQLQTQRVLRQYQHLIARAKEREACESKMGRERRDDVGK